MGEPSAVGPSAGVTVGSAAAVSGETEMMGGVLLAVEPVLVKEVFAPGVEVVPPVVLVVEVLPFCVPVTPDVVPVRELFVLPVPEVVLPAVPDAVLVLPVVLAASPGELKTTSSLLNF